MFCICSQVNVGFWRASVLAAQLDAMQTVIAAIEKPKLGTMATWSGLRWRMSPRWRSGGVTGLLRATGCCFPRLFT
jgi:hypothetical protein